MNFNTATSHMITMTVFTMTTLVLDLTGGEFEKNLASVNLIEGKDYYLFS